MNVNPNKPQHATGRPAAGTSGLSRMRPNGAERAGSPGTAGSPTPGTVELSPRAQEFLRIRARLEAAAGQPREARIAELRDLVARGAYRIDGTHVADAILRDDAAALALGLGSS